MELILAIYGAILSTTLAAMTIIKFLDERTQILVKAVPVSRPAAEDDDTHGVLVRAKRGYDEFWEEVDIEIQIRNAGGKACQISDVFIETAASIQQVRPDGIPIVLDPRTACDVKVQPEYFAPKKLDEGGKLETVPVTSVGVFDALGKKHLISQDNLTTLVHRCAELPLRTAIYKHKETGNLIVAFQVKDAAAIVSKD